MNVNDALQRIILSIGIGALLIGFITHVAARRLMLGGLDDMFVRLYGSTVVGSIAGCENIGFAPFAGPFSRPAENPY